MDPDGANSAVQGMTEITSMPDCNCSELSGGTLSSSVNSRFGRRDEVCVGVRPSPHDPFTLSAPTLRRGVSKGPHNSVFGRGREQHRWKGVAPALRYAPALHRRYSGRVVCVGHSSLNGYPDPDSLLTGPAGVTDCLRCHSGAPCRGWIPAQGDLRTTVIPAQAGIQLGGSPPGILAISATLSPTGGVTQRSPFAGLTEVGDLGRSRAVGLRHAAMVLSGADGFVSRGRVSERTAVTGRPIWAA